MLPNIIIAVGNSAVLSYQCLRIANSPAINFEHSFFLILVNLLIYLFIFKKWLVVPASTKRYLK
jgi:hypothetical protein